MGLEGRIGLVTRGANGIGKAVCLKVARDGANVIIEDILEKETKDICRQIVESLSKKCLAIKLDVSSSNNVVSMLSLLVPPFFIFTG
jgi:NAD(P)-dependent dehydrogenase (short-subunit alcohol dehydrogenase family)